MNDRKWNGTWRRVLLAVLSVGMVAWAPARAQSPSRGWAAQIGRTGPQTVLLRVEAMGRKPDDGSGIIIGGNLVLTARHLVMDLPVGAIISALPGVINPPPDFGSAKLLRIVYVSAKNDFALLAPAGQSPGTPTILPTMSYAMGDPLLVIGYPGGESLVSTEGIVSAFRIDGTFATDAATGGGNSGGPVISDQGQLLGILVKQHDRNKDGDIELALVLSSKAIHEELQTTRFAQDFEPAPRNLVPPYLGPPPKTLTFAYRIDATKDDHPGVTPSVRDYQLVFQAQPNYHIRSAHIVSSSANNVATQPEYQIAPDGRSATVTFALRSGPTFDRWRGWLDANLVTDQVLQQ